MSTTLCANMIVRQEGRIITRCLQALVGVVSEFTILDTGSTDDTIEQISNFSGIPGTVHRDTFVDFAQARNAALAAARAHATASHLLFIDADMVFVVPDSQALLGFIDAHPPSTVFTLTQLHGTLEYANMRIIPRQSDAYYVGPTHEFLHHTAPVIHIPKHIASISDISDGGCKHDKIARDIRLLEHALSQNDAFASRYCFYLAQSYKDAGNLVRAKELYWQRANMVNTWIEEVCYSLFQILQIEVHEKNEQEALRVLALIQTTGIKRPEPHYSLCLFYMDKYRHAEAIMHIMAAYQNIPKNEPPLFYDRSVAAYLLDFQLSVALWYIDTKGTRKMGADLCTALLENPELPASLQPQVLRNAQFYK